MAIVPTAGINSYHTRQRRESKCSRPRPPSFPTEDPAGCSCRQIIDELGLGRGHEKFGCSISAMQDWVAIVSGL